MDRLILFDIDGTLLTTNGAGRRAFYDALEEVFGTRAAPEGFSFAGKTDPQIARELLAHLGLDDGEIETRLPALWAAYIPNLERELEAAETTRLPGVLPLLEELEASGRAVPGLLTGNIRQGARLKLQAAEIGPDRFVVGAFGSDHGHRPELPAVAVRRAEERTGRRFSGKSVVIIGDTPHDIACGAHLGVRTIAVATGSYPLEALAEHGPDHLLPSLEDLGSVRRAIFG